MFYCKHFCCRLLLRRGWSWWAWCLQNLQILKEMDKNNLNSRSYYNCTKLNKASNKQYILFTFNVQYSCSLSNLSVIRPLSSTYLFNNISAISWRSVIGRGNRIKTLSHNVVSSTPPHEQDSNSQLPYDHDHDSP